jgi:hypothetical protein
VDNPVVEAERGARGERPAHADPEAPHRDERRGEEDARPDASRPARDLESLARVGARSSR